MGKTGKTTGNDPRAELARVCEGLSDREVNALLGLARRLDDPEDRRVIERVAEVLDWQATKEVVS